MTPVLQTARLLLRPFTMADAGDVFAYASNPNVSRWTTWETHRTVRDAEGFVEMVLGRPATEYIWAITVIGEGKVVGAIEFSLKSETEAEFHYVLGEPYWNRGIMTEAGKAVLEWGLAMYPKVGRVATRAVTANRGSTRVMEKCGLTLVGTRLDKWAKYAEPVEQSEYELVR